MQALELKVTREDLAKAKGALQSLNDEIEVLKGELDSVNHQLATASDTSKVETLAEIEAIKRERDAAKDDLSNLQSAFTATKETFDAISQSHSRELEET